MIFHAPNTKRNRIASVIAISLGLVVGFLSSCLAVTRIRLNLNYQIQLKTPKL